jgi:hypothetical protein
MNKSIVCGLLRHFISNAIDKSERTQKKATDIFYEIESFMDKEDANEIKRQWNFFLQGRDSRDFSDFVYTVETIVNSYE